MTIKEGYALLREITIMLAGGVGTLAATVYGTTLGWVIIWGIITATFTALVTCKPDQFDEDEDEDEEITKAEEPIKIVYEVLDPWEEFR